MLRQESDHDCSVPAFATLTRISESEIRKDLPKAVLGQVTVFQWMSWLEKRGFEVLRREGCPSDIVPCVHLVAPHQPYNEQDFHWVYRDADGDVHDPSPVFEAMPADDPRMRNLSVYANAVMTLSISSPTRK
jgi:hypothetical protein